MPTPEAHPPAAGSMAVMRPRQMAGWPLRSLCALAIGLFAGVGAATRADDAGGRATAGRTLTVKIGASGPLVHPSISAAFAVAREGDDIHVTRGEYREAVVIRTNRVTLRADKGAVMRGVAADGKAAVVVKADGVTITGLECADIEVPDRNGACVRLEGRDLRLSEVYFHDSEQGVLTGGAPGTVMIEDSTFARLGRGGQAHGIYIGGGRLEIRRSRFLESRDEGHEIKSRALETRITDSIVASLGGVSSRAIDLPNGGVALIERSVIAHGPMATNRDLVSFGVEGNLHPGSALVLRGNLLLLERPGANVLVNAASSAAAPRVEGNVIVGRGQAAAHGRCNRVYGSRAEAGLPPAPVVPERPSTAFLDRHLAVVEGFLRGACR